MNWGDYFYYDETSPSCLRWKVKRGRVSADSPAGSNNFHRYWHIRISNVGVPVHKIVYELVGGVELKDGEVVDHVDGNPLNNVYTNLRAVPQNVNMRNLRKNFSSASGVVGVCLDTKKSPYTNYWVASWNDLNGEDCSQSYSVKEFGDEMAFLLACGARYLAIADLNAKGAGYADDHGNLRPKKFLLPVNQRQTITIDGVVFEQRVPESAFEED